MNQKQRERALKRFESNGASTLVATDVAARGLDLVEITHVINFDPGRAHGLRPPGRTNRPRRPSRHRSHARPPRAAGGRQPDRPRRRPRRAVRRRRDEARAAAARLFVPRPPLEYPRRHPGARSSSNRPERSCGRPGEDRRHVPVPVVRGAHRRQPDGRGTGRDRAERIGVKKYSDSPQRPPNVDHGAPSIEWTVTGSRPLPGGPLAGPSDLVDDLQDRQHRQDRADRGRNRGSGRSAPLRAAVGPARSSSRAIRGPRRRRGACSRRGACRRPPTPAAGPSCAGCTPPRAAARRRRGRRSRPPSRPRATARTFRTASAAAGADCRSRRASTGGRRASACARRARRPRAAAGAPGGSVGVAAGERCVGVHARLVEPVEDARRGSRQLAGVRVRVDDRPERIEGQLSRARADEPFELRVLDERLHLGRPEELARVEHEHRLVRVQELGIRRPPARARDVRRRERGRHDHEHRAEPGDCGARPTPRSRGSSDMANRPFGGGRRGPSSRSLHRRPRPSIPARARSAAAASPYTGKPCPHRPHRASRAGPAVRGRAPSGKRPRRAPRRRGCRRAGRRGRRLPPPRPARGEAPQDGGPLPLLWDRWRVAARSGRACSSRRCCGRCRPRPRSSST